MIFVGEKDDVGRQVETLECPVRESEEEASREETQVLCDMKSQLTTEASLGRGQDSNKSPVCEGMRVQ
jgi:hypothetical protein